jgi:hypothetical protein
VRARAGRIAGRGDQTFDQCPDLRAFTLIQKSIKHDKTIANEVGRLPTVIPMTLPPAKTRPNVGATSPSDAESRCADCQIDADLHDPGSG